MLRKSYHYVLPFVTEPNDPYPLCFALFVEPFTAANYTGTSMQVSVYACNAQARYFPQIICVFKNALQTRVGQFQ